MSKSKKASDRIVIKKYANRRLYDTSTSSYVTLDHLSDLVRREVDFEVVDAKTGEDLTRQVLTQIIFEHETKGEGALPINFLRQLISFYGGGSQQLLPAWLEMSMDSFAQAQERWKANIGSAPNPFALFETQAKANMEMFENALKMFKPGGAEASTETSESAKPSTAGMGLDPVSLMRLQMEAMQAQLNALSKKD